MMDMKRIFALDVNIDNLFQIINERDEKTLELGLEFDENGSNLFGTKANALLVTCEALIERYVARFYKGANYNINDIFLGNVKIDSSKINKLLEEREQLLKKIAELPNGMIDAMDPNIKEKREIIKLEVLAKLFAKELFPNEKLSYSEIVDRTYDAIFEEKGARK